MPVLNFPANPASQTPINVYSPTSSPASTSNSVTYVWDGVKWNSAGAVASAITQVTGESPITVDNSDPANPVVGIDGRFQYTTSVAQPTKTTEISVRGGNNGTCALVLCSRAINGSSSDNVIYMVSFTPTDLSAPTYTKISNTGNDNWVTFGVTADAVPLITVNGGSENCRFTFIY